MTILATRGAGFIGSNFTFILLFERPDMVVNFAAESHVNRSIENLNYIENYKIWGDFMYNPIFCN